MTNKQRLFHRLFERDGEKHLDIKFLCEGKVGLTVESICEQANKAMFEVDTGLVSPLKSFPKAASVVKIDVRELKLS